MGEAKVLVNAAGARAILNSEEVQADLLARAEAIKARAETYGSGTFEADAQPGKNRAHAMVKTTDAKSIASNAKHNSILKSIDAGR